MTQTPAMTYRTRRAYYLAQRGSLTPRQERRLRHKVNRRKRHRPKREGS